MNHNAEYFPQEELKLAIERIFFKNAAHPASHAQMLQEQIRRLISDHSSIYKPKFEEGTHPSFETRRKSLSENIKTSLRTGGGASHFERLGRLHDDLGAVGYSDDKAMTKNPDLEIYYDARDLALQRALLLAEHLNYRRFDEREISHYDLCSLTSAAFYEKDQPKIKSVRNRVFVGFTILTFALTLFAIIRDSGVAAMMVLFVGYGVMLQLAQWICTYQRRKHFDVYRNHPEKFYNYYVSRFIK